MGIYLTTVEWKDGLLQCADCGPSFTRVECPLLLCWALLDLHLVLDILAFKVSKGCVLAHKSMTDIGVVSSQGVSEGLMWADFGLLPAWNIRGFSSFRGIPKTMSIFPVC